MAIGFSVQWIDVKKNEKYLAIHPYLASLSGFIIFGVANFKFGMYGGHVDDKMEAIYYSFYYHLPVLNNFSCARSLRYRSVNQLRPILTPEIVFQRSGFDINSQLSPISFTTQYTIERGKLTSLVKVTLSSSSAQYPNSEA